MRWVQQLKIFFGASTSSLKNAFTRLISFCIRLQLSLSCTHYWCWDWSCKWGFSRSSTSDIISTYRTSLVSGSVKMPPSMDDVHKWCRRKNLISAKDSRSFIWLRDHGLSSLKDIRRHEHSSSTKKYISLKVLSRFLHSITDKKLKPKVNLNQRSSLKVFFESHLWSIPIVIRLLRMGVWRYF